MWTAVIICHPQGQIHNLLLAGFSFSDEIQWVRVRVRARANPNPQQSFALQGGVPP